MSRESRARWALDMLQRFTILRVCETFYARGYNRGYDVATARAEIRHALVLPLGREA